MPRKNRFSLLLSACAFLLFGASAAQACECMLVSRTVLEEYDTSKLVLIARVASVEKAGKDAAYKQFGVNSTMAVVEKVFKGSIKVGDGVRLDQGGPGECIWAFNEEMVGRRYLLYLGSREERPEIWRVSVCGRSTDLSQATDDLSYLNKLGKVRGKTRISGTVAFEGETASGVGGRVIRIAGANKVHEVKTDEKGFYEIYDLPAGAYRFEIETPSGWTAESYYEPRSYTTNFDGRGEDESPKQFYIFLEKKKHVSFDLRFRIDKTVRGKTETGVKR